jgi:hypothetical protein
MIENINLPINNLINEIVENTTKHQRNWFYLITILLFIFTLFNFIIICIYWSPNPCLINTNIYNYC